MSSKNVVDLRPKRHEGSKVRRTGEAAIGLESLRNAAVREERSTSRQGRTPVRPPAAMLARRESALRLRRRKWRVYAILALVIICAGGAYGISAVSYLPQYNISKVNIVGTQQIPASLVNDYAEMLLNQPGHPFISQNNIIIFNTRTFGDSIAHSFPRIKSVQVNRDALLATSLTVRVEERQPFAKWCAGGASSSPCYFMDDSGVVFASIDSSLAPQTQYLFMGGVSTTSDAHGDLYIGETFIPAHFPALRALFVELANAGFNPTGASVLNDRDATISLIQGYQIKISYGEDPETIIRDLKLVLSSSALQDHIDNLAYIDLRFGDRAYFKLKTDISKTPAQ